MSMDKAELDLHATQVEREAFQQWWDQHGTSLVDYEKALMGWLARATRAAQTEQQPAECTNEDSWNCKYCRKTEACEAIKDPRNFAAPIAQDEWDTFCAYCGGNDEYPQDHCMDCKRPLAQTEQEPVGEVRCDGDMIWQIDGDPAVWRGLGEGTKLYAAPIAQTAPQPEQEPFWYAVVSEQAPSINSAIKRLDVAQEFADSKRERWPDTRVVPLYAAPQPGDSL